MGAQTFHLPDLGEGLTEGTIVEWLVDVGDEVVVDQPVAEVETAKAVVEVPSPFAGTVVERHASAGEEVAVGAPLLSLDPAGGAGAGGAAVASSEEAATATADTGADADADDGSSGSVLVGYGTSDAGARSRRRRSANGAPVTAADPEVADGEGNGQAPAAPPTDGRGRPLAKPPVRKLAKDLGVDLWHVIPTGAGGVITREDVRAAADCTAEPTDEAAAHSEAVAAAPARAEVSEAEVERVPLSSVRQRIAARMSTSRGEIPEATTWLDIDASELLALRDELNRRHDDVRVTPLALVLRATVAALRRFPDLNARFDPGGADGAGVVERHRAVHLGVAVQTDRGLLVPVVRDADRRSTIELAGELDRLASGARAGTLRPDELSGSTFTVSNYGAFGVDGGNPVINHPEVAILGVGRIADRPWVVGGELAVRPVAELSVAFDHRVADGGEGAGFLRHLADLLGDRAALVGAL